MLVDTHCHLDFPDFEDDLDGVVSRAVEAGVAKMVTICTHVTRFERVLAIAERFENVYCTVGIHPHEAGNEPEVSAERLVELARHPKVVGFGETGLDYFYEHAPREDQRRNFHVHIEAARISGLPIVVHTRDADTETAEILRREMEKGAFCGLLHCFSSSGELALAALDLGFYISLSGIVTFKKADALRQTVQSVPTDRILVETDAPFLAPIPKRGKRNEPAFTAHTAACVARIKHLELNEFSKTTTENFHRLFKKAAP